jgi:hypothetical protein
LGFSILLFLLVSCVVVLSPLYFGSTRVTSYQRSVLDKFFGSVSSSGDRFAQDLSVAGSATAPSLSLRSPQKETLGNPLVLTSAGELRPQAQLVPSLLLNQGEWDPNVTPISELVAVDGGFYTVVGGNSTFEKGHVVVYSSAKSAWETVPFPDRSQEIESTVQQTLVAGEHYPPLVNGTIDTKHLNLSGRRYMGTYSGPDLPDVGEVGDYYAYVAPARTAPLSAFARDLKDGQLIYRGVDGYFTVDNRVDIHVSEIPGLLQNDKLHPDFLPSDLVRAGDHVSLKNLVLDSLGAGVLSVDEGGSVKVTQPESGQAGESGPAGSAGVSQVRFKHKWAVGSETVEVTTHASKSGNVVTLTVPGFSTVGGSQTPILSAPIIDPSVVPPAGNQTIFLKEIAAGGTRVTVELVPNNPGSWQIRLTPATNWGGGELPEFSVNYRSDDTLALQNEQPTDPQWVNPNVVLPLLFEGFSAVITPFPGATEFPGYSGDTQVSIIDNPDQTAPNQSSKVVEFKKNNAIFSGFFIDLTQKIPIKSNPVVSLMVRTPFDNQNFLLKLEDKTNSNKYVERQVSVQNTVGSWTQVSFDFSNIQREDNVYDRIVFIPDFGNGRTPGTIYIDQVLNGP